MKRILVGGLLSCLVIGQAFAAQDGILKSSLADKLYSALPKMPGKPIVDPNSLIAGRQFALNVSPKLVQGYCGALAGLALGLVTNQIIYRYKASKGPYRPEDRKTKVEIAALSALSAAALAAASKKYLGTVFAGWAFVSTIATSVITDALS